MKTNPFPRALEIIRRRGMAKDIQEDSKGRVCLYGALSLAAYGHTYNGVYPHREIMDGQAKFLFPDRYGYGWSDSAASVNNHPDTTQEDVELILKHSAYEWDLQYAVQE